MAVLDLQIGASEDDKTLQNGTTLASAGALLIAGHNSGEYWHTSLRFTGAAIPQGATIETAYLIFTAFANKSEVDVLTNIYGADEDDPATPASAADFLARPRTAATLWDNLPSWTTDTEYQSPELKVIVQAIVDRPGFAGDAMLFFWEDDGSSDPNAARWWHSYDSDPLKATKLYAEYITLANRRRRRLSS